jgi:hypothetical protein
MAKNNDHPITINGFNVIAIFLVLLILPFSTAFISNGLFFSRDYDDYEPLLENVFPATFSNPQINEVSNLVGASWYNNGNTNYTGWYEGSGYTNADDLECISIRNGICQGYSGGPSSFTQNWLGNNYPQYIDEKNRAFWTMPKTHGVWASLTTGATYTPNSISDADYPGSSGTGNFDLIFPNMLKSIDQQENIDNLKFTFIDDATTYGCSTHSWDTGSFDGTIQFRYYDNATSQYIYSNKFDKRIDWDNKYEWTRSAGAGLAFNTDCFHGIEFNYSFDYLQAYEIMNFNPNGIQNVETIISIDNICLNDITNTCRLNGFVELGFNGVDDFVISVETMTLETAVIDTSVRLGTIFLSIVIFLIAMASTTYWNPLKAIFGRL